jgi:predicted TIM-barrel fold metal-dependent hydrolase
VSQATAPLDPAPDIGADTINLPIDHEWLALYDEEVLEPDLPIVDAHHHLWDRPGSRYMPPDLLADATGGHNVVASVYVENNAFYRSFGPVELRPVGETEVIATIGAGPGGNPAGPRLNAAIVGYADLLQGAAAGGVLEAHVAAGQGRFRGVRQVTAWDEARSVQTPQHGPRRPLSAGMMKAAAFREGFACLAQMGLSFDAWLYHPQLEELVELAGSFPDTRIVLNHIGGPVRVGPYRGKEEAAFAQWAASMERLARCPNVSVKIGGLGMRLLGFGFRNRPRPPSSADLAESWRPFVEHCIDHFGTRRCMFESNFPVDKAYFSYRVLWNAFKLLTVSATPTERRDLFYGTAARIYGLDG